MTGCYQYNSCSGNNVFRYRTIHMGPLILQVKHRIYSNLEKNAKTKKSDQNLQRESAAMKQAEGVQTSSHSLSSNSSYDVFPIQM